MSSKIKDGLFMGDIDAAQDADFLQLNGIMHIINCVPRQMPNIFQQSLGLSYTACDLEETLRRPFFDLKNRDFVHILQLIDRALEHTESVLVHSLNGINRSPSVMIGYLMVKYCWGLDKAHEFVLTKRSDMKLHESYIDQLCILESQIQEDRPVRATERQLYEWSTLSADSKTDEIVLIHTFLNSATKPDDNAHEKRRLDISKRHGERQLTWIDQAWELRNFSPLMLERPPNHSYNKMIAADGWEDLLDPSSVYALHNSKKKITTVDGGLHAAQMAFTDLSCINSLDTPPSHIDLDNFGPKKVLGPLGLTEVPILQNSKRFHSFSAPKQFEILDDEASTCPSTASEELDFTPRNGSSTPKNRYNRETLTSGKVHPRRFSSTALSASSSLKRVSFPANGHNNSLSNAKSAKSSNGSLKGVTKRMEKMATAPGSRNGASGGRVFKSVDLPLPSSVANLSSRRLNGHILTGSARLSVTEQLQKSASIRPQTAPPRIRTDVETKDLLQSKRVDLNGLGLVTIDPIKSHRLHSSLDNLIGTDLDASLTRGLRRTSAFNGVGRAKTARASWR